MERVCAQAWECPLWPRAAQAGPQEGPLLGRGPHVPPCRPGLAVGLDPQGYGNPDFCWLSLRDTLIWSFAGPIGTVIIVSPGVFAEPTILGDVRSWVRGLGGVLGAGGILGSSERPVGQEELISWCWGLALGPADRSTSASSSTVRQLSVQPSGGSLRAGRVREASFQPHLETRTKTLRSVWSSDLLWRY